jgi:hypothetical protein
MKAASNLDKKMMMTPIQLFSLKVKADKNTEVGHDGT